MNPEETKKVRKTEDDLAELKTMFLAIFDWSAIIDGKYCQPIISNRVKGRKEMMGLDNEEMAYIIQYLYQKRWVKYSALKKILTDYVPGKES